MTATDAQLEFGTQSLLVALSARHPETGAQTGRVSDLALRLGRRMNLPAHHLYDLKFGSLLHDIGKVETPDRILCKPAGLEPDEWSTMRAHPVTGANMLRALGYPEGVCVIVEQHHERVDGSGYPYGLRSSDISWGARILCVADSYDAIVSHRIYRRAQPHNVALHEISSCAGSQFDQTVVEALFQLLPPHRAAA